MAEFRNPIDQLIIELGGTVKVAAALGVAPTVVSTWRTKNKIPYWRVEPIRKLAKKLGVTIPETVRAAA